MHAGGTGHLRWPIMGRNGKEKAMVEHGDDGQGGEGQGALAGTALGKLLGLDGGATVRENDVTGGRREGQATTPWAALSKLLGIGDGEKGRADDTEKGGRETEGLETVARSLERAGALHLARWLRRVAR